MDEPEKVAGVDDRELTIEQQQRVFAQEQWHADLALRRRELALKEEEKRHHHGFFGRLDPVRVGLFTAALALVGNRITTTMQNKAKCNADKSAHDRQIAMDREHCEADLIKDSMKAKPEHVVSIQRPMNKPILCRTV